MSGFTIGWSPECTCGWTSGVWTSRPRARTLWGLHRDEQGVAHPGLPRFRLKCSCGWGYPSADRYQATVSDAAQQSTWHRQAHARQGGQT